MSIYLRYLFLFSACDYLQSEVEVKSFSYKTLNSGVRTQQMFHGVDTMFAASAYRSICSPHESMVNIGLVHQSKYVFLYAR